MRVLTRWWARAIMAWRKDSAPRFRSKIPSRVTFGNFNSSCLAEPREEMTMTQPEILIIGGGFAGFWAAVAARRVAGPRAVVTLVSPAPVLEIRPRLYEASPETLGVDLLPLLRKVDVSFVRGEAIRLDTAAKAVTLAAGDRLVYDRLVVATGSRMRRPPVPGAEESFSVDTQAEAIAF